MAEETLDMLQGTSSLLVGVVERNLIQGKERA